MDPGRTCINPSITAKYTQFILKISKINLQTPLQHIITIRIRLISHPTNKIIHHIHNYPNQITNNQNNILNQHLKINIRNKLLILIIFYWVLFCFLLSWMFWDLRDRLLGLLWIMLCLWLNYFVKIVTCIFGVIWRFRMLLWLLRLLGRKLGMCYGKLGTFLSNLKILRFYLSLSFLILTNCNLLVIKVHFSSFFISKVP